MAKNNWNPESEANQTSMLLAYLRKHITITAIEALDVIGTMRLAALVFNLREKGYDIRTEKITVPSGKRVALYRFYDNGL